MKTSYSHLPDYAKNDLQQIVTLILERVPHCEMIILYGSYARGTFVEYDERDEFGILTSFMSDYDLLVVTSNEDVREVGHLLDTVDDKYYKRPDNQVPIQFINDDIEKLNSDLSEGRYFYTSIQKQGIMLYDSGNYKLERPGNFTLKRSGNRHRNILRKALIVEMNSSKMQNLIIQKDGIKRPLSCYIKPVRIISMPYV